MPDDTPNKVWLDRRHPDYATYVGHWEFLRDSYVGGPTFAQNHLAKFWREEPDAYAERLERAHRYNYTAKIVDIVNGYLFQRPPARKMDRLPKPLQEFWNDADRERNPINTVMAQKIAPWTSVFGRLWIVVDKPAEQAQTRADERAQRLFPYLTLFAPIDVLDARYINGELEWMLLRERIRDDADPLTSSGKVEERFRLWTRTSWSLWKIDENEKKDRIAVQVGAGEHTLGVVPIVPVDHKAPITTFVAPSLVGELAYLDRSIFNHISLLDAILYDVTFPQLAIPWQALPPGEGEEAQPGATSEEQRVIQMATRKAFVYDATSPTRPDWMAPDPSPAQTLRERIKEEIDELFRSVALQGEFATEVSEASGISKEHEFRKLSKLLAVMADNLESAERRILKIGARWQGIDPDSIEDDVVDYPETFDVKTLLEELEEIKEMQAAGLPDLVLNEARKEVAEQRFSKLDPDKLEALKDAIDKIVGVPTVDLDEEEERQRLQRQGAGAGTGTGE